MVYTAQEICDALHLDLSEIVNIYPYGSKIYGTADEFSDDDYAIVYKRSLLPSGSFKDNAISSDDWKIQGVCYSRGGFIDAINNYQITALECIFLPDDLVVQKKMDFPMTKFNKKELAKNIISTASASWHLAKLSYVDQNPGPAMKNIFHAIRILEFGLQIKNKGRIVDYGSENRFKEKLYRVGDYNPKTYLSLFMSLQSKLKE